MIFSLASPRPGRKSYLPGTPIGLAGLTLERLGVRTGSRREVIDVTDQVQAAVARAGVRQGLALVHCPHTTAAVVVNERDPALQGDLLDWAARTAPEGGWRHDASDGNGHAHLQGMLLNPSAVLPVEGGRLVLGTWQSVLLVELDGPRSRELWVQVVGR